MAFKRIIDIDVGDEFLMTKISNLFVDFDIIRSTSLTENIAKISIYNTNTETREKILQKNKTIIVNGGYFDENTGMIFVGVINQVQIRKENTNIITEIIATDILNNNPKREENNIHLSYMPKTSLAKIIQDIGIILDFPTNGLQNVTQFMNKSFVYSGSINGLFEKLQNILFIYNLSLYFDSSELVIYRNDSKDSTFGIVNINKNSGLISVKNLINSKDSLVLGESSNNKKISITSLFNFKIRPRTLIDLKSYEETGLFSVNKVRFKGNNYGGDFFTETEAIA